MLLTAHFCANATTDSYLCNLQTNCWISAENIGAGKYYNNSMGQLFFILQKDGFERHFSLKVPGICDMLGVLIMKGSFFRGYQKENFK